MIVASRLTGEVEYEMTLSNKFRRRSIRLKEYDLSREIIIEEYREFCLLDNLTGLTPSRENILLRYVHMTINACWVKL